MKTIEDIVYSMAICIFALYFSPTDLLGIAFYSQPCVGNAMAGQQCKMSPFA